MEAGETHGLSGGKMLVFRGEQQIKRCLVLVRPIPWRFDTEMFWGILGGSSFHCNHGVVPG